MTIIRRQAYDFTVKPKSYLKKKKKMGRNVLWFEINMLTLQPVLALLIADRARGGADTYIITKAYLALWF